MWQRLSRSELLSTFFPTWIWQGRMWSTWRIPKYDPYYWINAHAHPVVSTYYPFSAVVSYALGIFRPQGASNKGYISLLALFGAHIIFGAIGWYTLVHLWANSYIAIFGAITFTLAGYNWKQQPCTQYTFAWFPWLLYGIATNNVWLAGFSSGMIYLAGYYPIGIQCLAVAFLATLAWSPSSILWIPIGIVIGLPQLIPFIKYLPKTIRAKKVSSIGKVPWWQFGSLVFPKAFRFSINGVGYWEMSYYIGIIPLMTIWYTRSLACLLIIFSSMLMLGAFSEHLPRIPARYSYTLQFALIWSALSGLNELHLPNHVLAILCLIQAYDLWHNNSPLLVNHPYAELYNKPSWVFNTRLTRFLEANLGDNRVSGLPYPLFTGHINRLKTIGYCGGMQLKLMAKWRGDDSSDGQGQHDFFKGDGDPNDLTRSRVLYAYTTQVPDWVHTSHPYLYRNPAL